MNTEEKFILGALVGGALGAAAALFLTPMAGKNLRTKLMNGLSHASKPPRRKPVAHGEKKTHHQEHHVKKVRAKKKVSH